MKLKATLAQCGFGSDDNLDGSLFHMQSTQQPLAFNTTELMDCRVGR